MRLFKITTGFHVHYDPQVKYVVARTIREALENGQFFPGGVDVVKVEELAGDVLVIE